IAWIKWDEASNSISLGDPKTGLFSASGQPGSNRTLKAGKAQLDLRNSRVIGSGLTGQSVTLTFALRLNIKKRHGHQPALSYRVETYASDDAGNSNGFDQGATLRVTGNAPSPRA